jgi:phosphoglycolate phosphatase
MARIVFDLDGALVARAGHGLAVCTRKANAPGLAILRALRLMPPVGGFTGGDSLGVLKPDPRWHAADQLGQGPVVLVGDSATDAAAARGAGVPFVRHGAGYGRGDIAPRAVFHDFVELPGIVAALPDLRVPA